MTVGRLDVIEQKSTGTTGDSRLSQGRELLKLCASIARATARRGQADLAPLRVSLSAYNLLSMMDDHENMTIADAAEALGIENATASSLVGRMERDGLIQKTKSTVDKRSTILTKTPLAVQKMKEAEDVMNVIVADATHHFTELQRVTMLELFRKLLANIDPSSVEKSKGPSS